MTDLPTRLRTEADGDIREYARDSLIGIHPDQNELRGWATLMEAAADEIERLRQAALPIDDATRSLNDSILPSVMIWNGGEAYDELTKWNTLPATDPRSLDLDACAIAVGIYRAMTAAAENYLKPSTASSPIVKAEKDPSPSPVEGS